MTYSFIILEYLQSGRRQSTANLLLGRDPRLKLQSHLKGVDKAEHPWDILFILTFIMKRQEPHLIADLPYVSLWSGLITKHHQDSGNSKALFVQRWVFIHHASKRSHESGF